MQRSFGTYIKRYDSDASAVIFHIPFFGLLGTKKINRSSRPIIAITPLGAVIRFFVGFDTPVWFLCDRSRALCGSHRNVGDFDCGFDRYQ